jgi:hypothetical protein
MHKRKIVLAFMEEGFLEEKWISMELGPGYTNEKIMDVSNHGRIRS